MKKAILMAILTATFLQCCMKPELVFSNEVLVSITNECRARIFLYNSMIAIKVKPGTYKVKAETFQGKSVIKTFKKGPYAQTLDIEF